MVDKHEIIKGMLQLKGTSISGVARSLGVAPTTVTVVSKGLRRSRRIERALAQAIGSTPEVVWPERYAPVCLKPAQSSPTAVRRLFGSAAVSEGGV